MKESGSAPSVFSAGLALTAGMFVVQRAAVNQFNPYCAEAAFAGVLALLVIVLAGLQYASNPNRVAIARNFIIAAGLWIVMFAIGALRSPHEGLGIPQASDACLYILLALAGCMAAQSFPRIENLIIKLVIAMCAVETIYGAVHIFIDMPRLRAAIAAGDATVPPELQSSMGQLWLTTPDAYGTFGNPNSLAGFLLIGIFLTAGVILARRFRQSAVSLTVLLTLVVGLFLTNSKGAFVGAVAGAWFFVMQILLEKSPRWGDRMKALTIAGIPLVLLVLVLAASGRIDTRAFGLSMQIRFEYWKAAFAMIAQAPLRGVGLGGFGELYSYHKTPMGWEVRDAHNDYLQLAAELSVLAPLLYLVIWRILLREPPLASGFRQAEQATSAGDRKYAILSVAGATLIFLTLFLAFTPFDGDGLRAFIFDNASSFKPAASFLITCLLPVIFAGVAIFLPDVDSASSRIAFRAAAGAVLVHQLVDFDFKSQAVMSMLFLVAGCQFAGAHVSEPSRRTPKFVLALPFAGALALLPFAVWIPLAAGIPGNDAAALEHTAREIRGKPDLNVEEYRKMAEQIVASRRMAARAAPFDADVWSDLADALLEFGPNTVDVRDEALHAIERACDARPHAAPPRAALGNFYLRGGVRESRNGGTARAVKAFAVAEKAYAAASALYPLHPGLRLMQGDALLLQGRTVEANAIYAEAFAVDTRIDDPNVYLSSIFTDPRPGAFARHGFDAEIDGLIEQSHEKNDVERKGLLVREVVALAFLLKSPAGQKQNDNRKALLEDLNHATTDLVKAMDGDISEQAHAALLRALALKFMNASADQQKNAWQAAEELQKQSILGQTPGTPPRAFERLKRYFLESKQ